MPTPIPILPPIPAPDAIYKNDLGKTLAAQNQYRLLAMPDEAIAPDGVILPEPLYFPTSVFGDVPPDMTPPPAQFGQNVNNLLL